MSKKRGTDAMLEIDFLPGYKGIAVHDFYNQHPEIGSRQHYMDCLKQNYDRILEEAVKQNPLPEKQVNRRGKPKKESYGH